MIKEFDFNYQRQFGHRDLTSSQGDAEKLSSRFPAAKKRIHREAGQRVQSLWQRPQVSPAGHVKLPSCQLPVPPTEVSQRTVCHGARLINSNGKTRSHLAQVKGAKCSGGEGSQVEMWMG